ncbi:MAG: hypothetical protein AAFU74_00925 [Bacteroidota bacterium]
METVASVPSFDHLLLWYERDKSPPVSGGLFVLGGPCTANWAISGKRGGLTLFKEGWPRDLAPLQQHSGFLEQYPGFPALHSYFSTRSM